MTMLERRHHAGKLKFKDLTAYRLYIPTKEMIPTCNKYKVQRSYPISFRIDSSTPWVPIEDCDV